MRRSSKQTFTRAYGRCRPAGGSQSTCLRQQPAYESSSSSYSILYRTAAEDDDQFSTISKYIWSYRTDQGILILWNSLKSLILWIGHKESRETCQLCLAMIGLPMLSKSTDLYCWPKSFSGSNYCLRRWSDFETSPGTKSVSSKGLLV